MVSLLNPQVGGSVLCTVLVLAALYFLVFFFMPPFLESRDSVRILISSDLTKTGF